MTATPATALARSARDLADEVRVGFYQHLVGGLPGLDPRITTASEGLIAELRARCPGCTREEYAVALDHALASSSRVTGRERLLAWAHGLAAFTFVWGLVVVPFGPKLIIGSAWLAQWGYPLGCLGAAAYLLATRKRGRFSLAAANVACAAGWVLFVLWSYREVGSKLWP
ncbi:MAG TPA: hypothetical protein VGE76_09690 [Opitutaceae bacterium]